MKSQPKGNVYKSNFAVQLLVGSSEDRNAPTQYTIQEELYDEDEIPPYVSEYGSTYLTTRFFTLLLT